MANPLSLCRLWFGTAVLAIAATVAGCASQPPASILTPDTLPAEYAGRLPCADCAGIVYRLTLGGHHRYILSQHYKVESPTADVIETGRWAIEDRGQRLRLTPSNSDYAAQSAWRIDGDQALTAVEDDGQPIDPGDAYEIKRRGTPAVRGLTGVRWQLANAPQESMANPVYIRFDEHATRLAGSSGCNRLTAAYHRDGAKLSVQRLATTRRDCPGRMDTEQSLTAALRQTTRYAVVGQYLLLYGRPSDPAPLAVFSATR